MSDSSNKKTLTVRVSSDLINSLSTEAEAQGFTNRSEYIRYILRNGLNESQPPSEEHAESLRTSRQQLNQGQSISDEEVFAALRSTDSEDEFVEQLGIDRAGETQSQPSREEAIYDTSVIACGGGGISVLHKALDNGLKNANTHAFDTDGDAVRGSSADTAVRIGEDDLDEYPIENFEFDSDNKKLRTFHSAINETIGSAETVVILSGIGGKSGTYLAPHVAHVAAEQGSTVIAIGTLPFRVETERRGRAKDGVGPLANVADTVVLLDGTQVTRDDRGHAFTPAIRTMNKRLGKLVARMCGTECSYQMGGEEVDLQSVLSDRGIGYLVSGETSAADVDAAQFSDRLETEYISPEQDVSDAEFCLLNLAVGDKVEDESLEGFVDQVRETGVELAYSRIEDADSETDIRWTGVITGFNIDPEDLLETPDSTFDFEIVESSLRQIEGTGRSKEKQDNTPHRGRKAPAGPS